MIPIDVDKKTARMPWGGAETGAEGGADTAVRDAGVEFPLNCFFGQMGVAPAPNKGELELPSSTFTFPSVMEIRPLTSCLFTLNNRNAVLDQAG